MSIPMDLVQLQSSPPFNSHHPLTPSSSYWCYQCTRGINVEFEEEAICPHCGGGFVQVVDPTDFSTETARLTSGVNRRRRNGPSFNPLIFIRNPSATGSPEDGSGRRTYELYYDDGTGLGLRPLPSSISATLLGSGFELMLDRLSQIEFSLWARPENPPASKHAMASLPTVEILPGHVDIDTHCAICTDAFTLGSEAREMPCKHIYHSDCIFPWLNIHNSCPVCRQELPSDESEGNPGCREQLGLTIWRLPGGGFAIGRFVGGVDGNMPAVYSEVDGILNLNSGVSSRGIEWGPWTRRRQGGPLRRFFGHLGSLFRRGHSGTSGASPVRNTLTVSNSGSGSGRSILSRYALSLRRTRSREPNHIQE